MVSDLKKLKRHDNDVIKKQTRVPGWLSQLSTQLDFSSGLVLQVVSSSPALGSTLSMEPT